MTSTFNQILLNANIASKFERGWIITANSKHAYFFLQLKSSHYTIHARENPFEIDVKETGGGGVILVTNRYIRGVQTFLPRFAMQKN